MTAEALPDTGVLEDVLEDITEALPCERPKSECLSSNRRPASWFFSHLDAESGCTWLLCDPCKRNVDRLIAKANQLNYHKVVCKGCRKLFHTEDLIIRQI